MSEDFWSLSARSETKRPAPWGRATLAGLATGLLVASLLGSAGALLDADPAHAADDDLTSSAVTLTNANDALVSEGAPFPDLEVSISQTKDLVSQGIRISWTGGKQSTRPSGNVGGADFLQIAQCWGEDPTHPGHPDRRTCQYGGTVGWGATRDGNTRSDAVAPEDLPYTHLREGSAPTYTAIPFVAVNGSADVDEKTAPADRVLNNLTTEAGQVVQKPDSEFVDLNTNQFFTAYTTNEVRWAGAGADGSGSVPFEVQTNMQSTALGCGIPVTQTDGAVTGQPCWLVVIPRGRGDSGSSEINRPGLWWDAWEHHLAVKLEFKPLGVRCAIGAAERQLAGSELVGTAIASWQPALCADESGSPFVLNEANEADAVVRAAGTTPSPLAFTSRPLDVGRIGGGPDPLAYAPVALSGIAFSFSIDRQPHPQDASAEDRARAGLPFTEMNLTPRLVAKLLTASYVDALPSGADKSHIGYVSFAEPGKNARTIVQDKEFQAINDPEWSRQILVGASIADALVPSGRSDLAVRVWEYVLSDPIARAWLDGQPDENGMIVNPWYSTNSQVNPAGIGLALPADNFPKADPAEKPDTSASDPGNGTGAVNLVTWRPYTSSFANGAYYVLRGDGNVLGAWDRLATPPRYSRSVRELFGSQKVIGLSTTPAADLYQTVVASLRNPAGEFVAPTRESLAAAAPAMSPTASQPKVYQYDFGSDQARAATTSYPLSMPVYAALNPRQTDVGLRTSYANLIRFAASEGQQPGSDAGQLPPGYAPLPSAWVRQAEEAAAVIERGPQAMNSQPTASSPTARNTGTTPVPPPPLQPPTPADSSADTANPVASGAPAGPLVGSATAEDPSMGPLASIVPTGVGVGLASALGVLVMSRLRRRT